MSEDKLEQLIEEVQKTLLDLGYALTLARRLLAQMKKEIMERDQLSLFEKEASGR